MRAIEVTSQHPNSSFGTLNDSTSSNGNTEIDCPVEVPFRSLVQVLSSYISSKESTLECPVCYSVPSLPIYRCPNNHIICKICLPRLSKKCPTCRTRYLLENIKKKLFHFLISLKFCKMRSNANLLFHFGFILIHQAGRVGLAPGRFIGRQNPAGRNWICSRQA